MTTPITHTRVTVEIGVPDHSAVGKLAEAAIVFSGGGPLDGTKLVGFAVWESRTPGGKRNVTFPSRQYTVNKDKRAFALLRPIADSEATERVRQFVLDAYAAWEAAQ